MGLWLIPRPAKARTCRGVWRTPFKQVYRHSINLKPADPRHVQVVFKAKADVGYLPRLDDLIGPDRPEFIESLLNNLEKTSQYKAGRQMVCTFSTWLVNQCIDAGRVSAKYLEKVKNYIRNGRITWGLTPFNTHSEFFGLEEMCRSLYASRKLAERFGRPVPSVAMMNNIPAHTASLGMALAAAGGKIFHISAGPDMLTPAVRPLFWWKFSDGNKLLCHYQATAETTLLPPSQWPWSAWLSVRIIDQRKDYRSLDIIEEIDWLDANFDWPVCRIGGLEDFAKSVINRDGKKLPVIEDEFIDPWVPGIGSRTRATVLAREGKHRLPSVETLQTLAHISTGKAIPEKIRSDTSEAYDLLAGYTEHSWGNRVNEARKVLPKGNLYTSPAFAGAKQLPQAARWEASWDEKAGLARAAHKKIDRLQKSAVSSFMGGGSAGVRNTHIIVYNTLTRSRGGLVRITDARLGKGNFELVDVSTGAAVLYERCDGHIEFISPPVPACGYLALKVRQVIQRIRPQPCAEWDSRMSTMHNSDYSLQFHSAGGLARWFDRSHSCQWCSYEAEFPMGSYLYEMPGGERIKQFAGKVLANCSEGSIGLYHRPEYQDISQFGPVSGRPASIRHQITPLYARVTLEGNCPVRKLSDRQSGDIRRYRTTFTHYRGQSELYVNMRLMGKRATYAAEAGYAFFPFYCEDPLVMVDRIAHLALSDDQVAPGINADHMVIHRGMRIEGSFAGINFYPLHTPLVSIGSPGAYNCNRSGDEATGLVYATLFNNCWGTNYAQWQSGNFSFDFVINPTGNDDWDGRLHEDGSAIYRPLLGTVVKDWQNKPSQSLLHIKPSCVELITLKPAEFESGIIIRLWNADVEPVKADITLPSVRSNNSLWFCDLLERPSRRRVSINRGGRAAFSLKPNEIVTLLIQ
jgi:hypothetical protein